MSAMGYRRRVHALSFMLSLQNVALRMSINMVVPCLRRLAAHNCVSHTQWLIDSKTQVYRMARRLTKLEVLIWMVPLRVLATPY